MTMERLLAPIEGASPSGAWLRYDPLYTEVRRLREEDDPSLPQGVWKHELKRADWNGVAAACSEALASRTKDLQLAGWLTEAWTHLEGFAGSARGVRLVAAFCRDFWDSVHPAVDEDGSLDTRLAPIVWLAEKFPAALKRVRVTAPGGEGVPPYAWQHWEEGVYLARLAAQNAAAAASSESDGMVPQAKFLASVAATPAAWFVRLAADLDALGDAVEELGAVLDERCGIEAPSLRTLRDFVSVVRDFAGTIVDERVRKGELMSETAEPRLHVAGGENDTAAAAGAAAAPLVRSGGIGSRAEAYARLREVADYLMRTEPHSPVPYLVLRAVAWGDMTVVELYEELFQRNADLTTIYALLGIGRHD